MSRNPILTDPKELPDAPKPPARRDSPAVRALTVVIAAVAELEDRDQERVLNAACAYFGHFPLEKVGEIKPAV